MQILCTVEIFVRTDLIFSGLIADSTNINRTTSTEFGVTEEASGSAVTSQTNPLQFLVSSNSGSDYKKKNFKKFLKFVPAPSDTRWLLEKSRMRTQKCFAQAPLSVVLLHCLLHIQFLARLVYQPTKNKGHHYAHTHITSQITTNVNLASCVHDNTLRTSCKTSRSCGNSRVIQ